MMVSARTGNQLHSKKMLQAHFLLFGQAAPWAERGYR